MEYFIIAALLVYGIVKYDFRNQRDIDERFYKFIFVLMVLMSGLAYRVGADFVRYEDSFYHEYNNDFTVYIKDFWNLYKHQAGWTLLSTIVYKTTQNFTVFKLIQAIFFQYTVFVTIKRYTEYRYTALLLFFVFLFPQANFNVLRESFAIGFFLLSVPYLIEKKFLTYYLFVFCSFMFHSGAFIFIFAPLFLLINFDSKKKVVLTSIGAFVVSLIIAELHISDIIMGLIISSGSEDMMDKADLYLMEERYLITGFRNVGKSLLFMIINLIPIIYLSNKEFGKGYRIIQLSFMYVLINLCYNFIPILYRYKDYTFVVFYISVANFIVDFYQKKKDTTNNFFLGLILFALYLYPIRSYFSISEWNGVPLWVQYYPYHSIIDQGLDPVREMFFYK